MSKAKRISAAGPPQGANSAPPGASAAAESTHEAASVGAHDTPFRRIVTDFVANPVAIFGLALFGIILFLALFAPVISPQNPYDLAQLDVMDSRLPPHSCTATLRRRTCRPISR